MMKVFQVIFFWLIIFPFQRIIMNDLILFITEKRWRYKSGIFVSSTRRKNIMTRGGSRIEKVFLAAPLSCEREKNIYIF